MQLKQVQIFNINVKNITDIRNFSIFIYYDQKFYLKYEY